MHMIRCAVVDDEPLAVKLIENFISRTPGLELSVSFTDSIEATVFLKENPVDLLFLDIQMPDMNGMELSRSLPDSTRIVFTTAFPEYALDSYEVEALDFLVKPIRYDKFLRAADKARRWFELNIGNQAEGRTECPGEVFLRSDGGFRKVDLDRIIFVEGLRDYVRFHVEGEKGSIVTHLTMKSVEEMLPSDRFLRVSRSHIISLEKIRSVDRNFCIYIGDTMVKVTDMYRETFENFLKKRMAVR